MQKSAILGLELKSLWAKHINKIEDNLCSRENKIKLEFKLKRIE